jgi:hypothetical protein
MRGFSQHGDALIHAGQFETQQGLEGIQLGGDAGSIRSG